MSVIVASKQFVTTTVILFVTMTTGSEYKPFEMVLFPLNY